MANWLRSPGGYVETLGVVLASTTSQNQNTPASANTKSSYMELTSSIPRDCNGITLCMGHTANFNSDFGIDVALGAASSEVDILEGVSYFTSSVTRHMRTVHFPIYLPEGERLSWRAQSSQATKNAQLYVQLHYGGGFARDTFSRCVTLNFDSATTSGTTIDAGVTINTKGSYVQCIASTESDIEQLILLPGNGSETTRNYDNYAFDVAVGAASSEVDLIKNVTISGGTIEDQLSTAPFGPYPCHIPAGSRISARSQCSTAVATRRLIDLTLYGLS